MSEALILASTNPQYDDRLFIELRVQYMKIPSSEHDVYINCSECQNKTKTTISICSAGIMSLQFSLTMKSLSSYCGLVDAKIRASDKDLPVLQAKTVSFQ